MRDEIESIREHCAELVIVGNGNRGFAEQFRSDMELDGPLFVDPELRAYRAAGLRRGRVELLSPRMPLNALRSLRGGHRQTGVEGDPWQLGGVFVIRPGGELTYRQASREAGDHAPLSDILRALEANAPVIDASLPAPSKTQRRLGRALSAVVDPLVVNSFDRTGFRIHSLNFDPADLEVDLAGRRCVVTGANSGIGFEVAQALADLGAGVVAVCRNRERGEAAVQKIVDTTGNRNVELEVCDLSSLAAVRELAARLAKYETHVLIHNAGALVDERVITDEGIESTFACHVAGPFLLTALLRQSLERAGDGRVVWVSSGGMYTQRLQLEDIRWDDRPFDGVVAYAEAKRAQVILARMWAQEFEGTDVKVNAMHPGWADTPGVTTSLPRFHSITKRILRTPAEGADTAVWLAASPAAGELSGRFVFDREPRNPYWLPGTRESSEDRERLWNLLKDVCQVEGEKPS